MILGFLIADQKYYRNYIESNALIDLDSHFRVILLIDSSILRKKHLEPKNAIVEVFNLKSSKQLAWLNLIEEVVRTHNRKLSQSFKFREKRFYPSLKEIYLRRSEKSTRPNLFLKTSNLIFSLMLFLKTKVRKAILYLLSAALFYPILLRVAHKTDFSLHELVEKLEFFDIELLFIPSAGREAIAIRSIASCEKLNIQSFFLLDNWDNVSSKTVFWKKPNFLGTWGPQSALHAHAIQDFRPSQVFCLGTPRFEVYKHTKYLKSSFIGSDYILFLGSHLFFDEINVLKKIDTILSKPSSKLYGLKILYRPHPHRIRGFDFVSSLFNHVELDPELREQHCQEHRNSNFVTSLDYYPSLISNAQFVLCGLTSMLIEAQILKKPVGVFVHHESNNPTSPSFVYQNYVHFEGISDLSRLILIDSIDSIESSMLYLFESSLQRPSVNPKLDYFITTQPKSYGFRLFKTVESLAFKHLEI